MAFDHVSHATFPQSDNYYVFVFVCVCVCVCMCLRMRVCVCVCVCTQAYVHVQAVLLFITKAYMVDRYMVSICCVYSLAVTSDMHRPTCRTGLPATVHGHMYICFGMFGIDDLYHVI